MHKKIVLLIFLMSTISHAQNKRITKWYFGYEAGIDFSSGNPIADTTGKLISIEGSSSISDDQGNLLFYSNGEKIWNRNNDLMLNGNNLIGDQSAQHSSIIVPKPNDSSLYYLFTTTAFSGVSTSSGLRYNIVDMSLDGGLGGVTASKNILLHGNGTEDLAATFHCNAKDYWIVSRKNTSSNSLNFYCHLLDSNGLSSPVMSSFSTNAQNSHRAGLTFSQDGSTLCYTSYSNGTLIFDFDRNSGVLTVRDTIVHPVGETTYSNALSPDGSKLYITSWNTSDAYCSLSQYDLNSSDITASRVNIDSLFYNGSPNGFGWIGQVRLAPDQKIYVSRWDQNPQTHPVTYYSLDSLDVILKPNLAGGSCDFRRNHFHLQGKSTELGLPTFVSNFTLANAPVYSCDNNIGHQFANSLNVYLYPNPTTGVVTIGFGQLMPRLSISLTNALGQLVLSAQYESIDSAKIRIDSLPGVYFLHIMTEDGETKTLEVIKH